MAEIKINKDKAQDTVSKLNSLVQTELSEGILNRYKALESSFSVSCGEASESIIENLKKEETALSAVADLMQKINKYLSDSAESFALLDKDYENAFSEKLICKGGKTGE